MSRQLATCAAVLFWRNGALFACSPRLPIAASCRAQRTHATREKRTVPHGCFRCASLRSRQAHFAPKQTPLPRAWTTYSRKDTHAAKRHDSPRSHGAAENYLWRQTAGGVTEVCAYRKDLNFASSARRFSTCQNTRGNGYAFNSSGFAHFKLWQPSARARPVP